LEKAVISLYILYCRAIGWRRIKSFARSAFVFDKIWGRIFKRVGFSKWLWDMGIFP
jgi:hypothetical protein